MKRAVVVGASSGIGREVALELSRRGYRLGLAARRINLLENLKNELPGPSEIEMMDLAQPEETIARLGRLVESLGGMDLIVISSGTGHINKELEWSPEKETIEVNALGFAAVAGFAARYFLARGEGHIAGISSIAALRGSADAPAYAATKAFASNYLEGIRVRMRKAGARVTVTDVKPGFVDTAMAQGDGLFWVAPPRKAAEQICRAIRKKKSHVYVTRRWRLVAWLFKSLPGRIYARI